MTIRIGLMGVGLLAGLMFFLSPAYGAPLCLDEPAPTLQDDQPDDDGTEDLEEEKRLGPVSRRLARVNRLLESRYVATGKSRTCINTTRVKRSSALGDDSILFQMRGRRAVVAKMTQNCPNLGREDRFIYQSVNTNICRGQIVTIIDSFGRPFNSCTIDHFELYTRKPRTEQAED